MNGIQIIHPIISQNQIDPGTVANHFIIEYYRNVSNIGWNACVYLFDANCVVTCKDKNLGNAHGFLNFLSSESIKRANFDKMKTGWLLLTADTMMIHVFGHIQFVSFDTRFKTSLWLPFIEIFILKICDNNIRCTHHIFNF